LVRPELPVSRAVAYLSLKNSSGVSSHAERCDRQPMLEAAGGMDHLKRWGKRMAARPGVQKGMNP